MSRTLVLGDVHGAYRALEQVFAGAGVTPTDQIIFLGDVADGWPQTRDCVEFLRDWSERGNLVHLLGNHDDWMVDWFRHPAKSPSIWLTQGGRATIESYEQWELVPEAHKGFMNDARLHYIQEDRGTRRLFAHADWVPELVPEKQTKHTLIWGRRLVTKALRGDDPVIPEVDEAYFGHTSVVRATDDDQPVRGGNVWCVDTGAGWSGRLTLMDVETKECWQSDPVSELYPDVDGR